MVMIEITEDKFDDLYDNIESMLDFGSKAMSCLKKMKQERMGERMPDYRDDWRREREEREERENRRRFNNVNDDWNYPNRYGERGGGGYNGGGRQWLTWEFWQRYLCRNQTPFNIQQYGKMQNAIGYV